MDDSTTNDTTYMPSGRRDFPKWLDRYQDRESVNTRTAM